VSSRNASLHIQRMQINILEENMLILLSLFCDIYTRELIWSFLSVYCLSLAIRIYDLIPNSKSWTKKPSEGGCLQENAICHAFVGLSNIRKTLDKLVDWYNGEQ
jgi:hypothetical protein